MPTVVQYRSSPRVSTPSSEEQIETLATSARDCALAVIAGTELCPDTPLSLHCVPWSPEMAQITSRQPTAHPIRSIADAAHVVRLIGPSRALLEGGPDLTPRLAIVPAAARSMARCLSLEVERKGKTANAAAEIGNVMLSRLHAVLSCQSSLTCTLRILIVPAPCCRAIGPSSNIPLRSFTVSLPSSTTVISRPLAVIS